MVAGVPFVSHRSGGRKLRAAHSGKAEPAAVAPAVEVCETFLSIQGESSYAGSPCFFIRLAGCNLNCRYCDTPAARATGERVSVETLVAQVQMEPVPLCEITGGEPLLQSGFPELAQALRDRTDKTIIVETNGSCDLSLVPDGVIAVMDVKGPGSGAAQTLDMENLARLRLADEVKFVLTDRADYEWARNFVLRHRLTSRCFAVFFSPVFGGLAAPELAVWMLEDKLPVRIQVQLHKLWGLQ